MLISREQFMALTARINERYLPWLNVVQGDLTLSRLARLSLFQVSVGICFVLLNGTLNRIMVVELGRAAWLVSAMLALPLLLAPARVLIGYRSDTHQSFLGYRRLPYLWMGTMGQFGGLALMPFVLILMTSADASALLGLAWVIPLRVLLHLRACAPVPLGSASPLGLPSGVQASAFIRRGYCSQTRPVM